MILNFLQDLIGIIPFGSDEHRRAVFSVLGLGEEVGRREGGRGASVGQDHHLRRAGRHVDGGVPPADNLLCEGYPRIARAEDLVHLRDRLRAEGHCGHGLGARPSGRACTGCGRGSRPGRPERRASARWRTAARCRRGCTGPRGGSGPAAGCRPRPAPSPRGSRGEAARGGTPRRSASRRGWLPAPLPKPSRKPHQSRIQSLPGAHRPCRSPASAAAGRRRLRLPRRGGWLPPAGGCLRNRRLAAESGCPMPTGPDSR